jgi:hypothetical protein
VHCLRDLDRIALSRDVQIHHGGRFVLQVVVEGGHFNAHGLQLGQNRHDFAFEQHEVTHGNGLIGGPAGPFERHP